MHHSGAADKYSDAFIRRLRLSLKKPDRYKIAAGILQLRQHCISADAPGSGSGRGRRGEGEEEEGSGERVCGKYVFF